MSRILIITNRLVVGGPSIHLQHIVNYFNSKHELLLVYGQAEKGESSMEDIFSKMGVEMKKINSMRRSVNPINDYKFAKELGQIIKGFNPDIVHTHTSKPGFIGRIIASQQNIKRVIHTYHGLVFKGYFSSILSSILVKIDRNLANKTHHIIALSETQKQEIIDKYKIGNNAKVMVIPLAISSDFSDFTSENALEFREMWKIQNDTLLIAQVGRLTDIKGNSLMIDVFKDNKKKHDQKIVLFMVGDGELKQNLIEQAQSLHLKVAIEEPVEGADVVFTSWCHRLKELYSAMDLLVLTSKSEGTPLSIIEAQVSGTAVLAPNIGGIKDMVIDGKTALLYSNVAEFESILSELIVEKQKIFEMGDNAANFAASQYSLKRMLNSYENLYNL